jgi:hypothetical protein
LPFIPRSGLSFIEQLQIGLQMNALKLEIQDKSWIQRLAEKSTETPCIKDNRPFLTGLDRDTETAFLMRPSCKMWNCPSCAARNAKRWIARIIHHINHVDAPGGWFMFTLTAHENAKNEYMSVKNLRAGWKKLYNRMRDNFGISSYVKVWERHKDMRFHLHGMVDNADITERWLKDNARSCGMGYEVELHKVDNAGQVAGYIAKYFMKSESVTESIKLDYPKGLRRIEVSRNWMKLPDLIAEIEFKWIINETREGQLRNAAWYKETLDYRIVDLVGDTKK